MTEKKHLSSQFDSELNSVSARVLELGGLVESQLRQVIYALANLNTEVADDVIEIETRVNEMDVQIDHELTTIIARRQPTARDLRLLLSIAKITANLERAGDESTKIARVVKKVTERGMVRGLPASELRVSAEMASRMLRKSLDAFARLDVPAAYAIIREDDLIDAEFDGFVRKLVTYMMEDARTIGSSLDLVFVAKAIERIGDHAKNIAEQIVYIVKGEDVRHLEAPEFPSLPQES